ncbi:mechanosensitive ion channel family protein [uncultured Flavobacterium sp.]|uniref:mechanosensitive ion channel family protein n=1 Tax=uncultured Flavobacterium sp. TaxID=165435 RepID=UPI0030EE0C93|tara:strand:+ start:85528 stop:86064 length:537 start_codon:yes stop_codon:yes gene_type:complete
MLDIIQNKYIDQEIYTLVVLVVVFMLRYFFAKGIRKYAKTHEALEHRTNLVIKYVNFLIGLLAIITIVVIWGVKKDQLFLFISSIFTVVGVAAFAQWSLLSNITAGIIIFFAFPFKIGDHIKILDKDFPISGEIIDIKAFYILLKTEEGETVTYPNNILMQKGISVLKNHSEVKEFTD